MTEVAALTPLADHVSYAIERMEAGARMILDAIPNDSSLSSASFSRDVTQEIARQLRAYATIIQEKREMEEALKEMEPELRGMIYEQYKGTLHYPDQQRRYKRDLNICDRVRALTPGDTP